MPKNPPDQIHIRIDTQEQRSGIPDLLAAMPQVHIEVIPVRTGDYDVGGDPCRVIERKTASDFLASLTQGRLFAQLAALRKSRFAPILLLEGDPLRVDHSQMRPESIRGALAYIAADRRIPRTWSTPRRDSVRAGEQVTGMQLPAPRQEDGELLCPNSSCRSCCRCLASG